MLEYWGWRNEICFYRDGTVACGTYYEHSVTMKSGVTLRSETGSADCVTVDAESQGPTFLCLDQTLPVRIEGISITGG